MEDESTVLSEDTSKRPCDPKQEDGLNDLLLVDVVGFGELRGEDIAQLLNQANISAWLDTSRRLNHRHGSLVFNALEHKINTLLEVLCHKRHGPR